MLKEIVFAFFTAGAIALDVKTGGIPNYWNVLFFAAAVFFEPTATLFLTLFAALAFGFLAWRFGAWGAGDAKLFAVLSAWGVVFAFPPWFGIALFLLTAAWLASARWLKSYQDKYLRWPGALFMALGFLTWLVVDYYARSSW